MVKTRGKRTRSTRDETNCIDLRGATLPRNQLFSKPLTGEWHNWSNKLFCMQRVYFRSCFGVWAWPTEAALFRVSSIWIFDISLVWERCGGSTDLDVIPDGIRWAGCVPIDGRRTLVRRPLQTIITPLYGTARM